MSILNKQRIREDFSNAAKTYDAAAIVQEDICDTCFRTSANAQVYKVDTILEI